MKEKYYITTAIAYTSGKPHIGNTYEAILTDCLARFKRYQGYDVLFQTGTDEHGQKIEEKAKGANLSPKQFVDNVADVIKDIWNMVGVSYDKFIRTTDEYHEKQVQKIFKKLYEKGIFTRVHTKVGIAHLVNLFGPKVNQLTASAQIVADLSTSQRKKHISLR